MNPLSRNPESGPEQMPQKEDIVRIYGLVAILFTIEYTGSRVRVG